MTWKPVDHPLRDDRQKCAGSHDVWSETWCGVSDDPSTASVDPASVSDDPSSVSVDRENGDVKIANVDPGNVDAWNVSVDLWSVDPSSANVDRASARKSESDDHVNETSSDVRETLSDDHGDVKSESESDGGWSSASASADASHASANVSRASANFSRASASRETCCRGTWSDACAIESGGLARKSGESARPREASGQRHPSCRRSSARRPSRLSLSRSWQIHCPGSRARERQSRGDRETRAQAARQGQQS